MLQQVLCLSIVLLLMPPRCVNRAKSSTGKPVLINILAFSLVFHAVTFERGSFRKIAFLKSMPT